MKYLKIENKRAEYIDKDGKWKDISDINKDDLLFLLNKAVTEDFSMDDFEQDKLPNHAHQIIYGSLHEKFKDLLENKNRFLDESKSIYKEALEKYSKE